MNARLSDDDREGDGDKEEEGEAITWYISTCDKLRVFSQSPNCLKKKKRTQNLHQNLAKGLCGRG